MSNQKKKTEYGWSKEIENGKPTNEVLFHAQNSELKQVSEIERVFNRNKSMIWASRREVKTEPKK